MGDLLRWPAMSGQSLWGMVLVLGYPVLALAALETARAFGERRPLAADVLRQMAYLLLPSGAIWLILRVLADVPPDAWAVRTAETAFALTGLYLLLRLAQAARCGAHRAVADLGRGCRVAHLGGQSRQPVRRDGRGLDRTRLRVAGVPGQSAVGPRFALGA
jgi:hypothetical protein